MSEADWLPRVLAPDATREDVATAFRLAFKLGLKVSTSIVTAPKPAK